MHSHATETLKKGEKIVIVGNPNVGKSVIFGLLTGRYATVSNYPGTTVTITGGSCNLGGNSFPVIDTPGINTLIPMSEDEVVTRDILLNESIKLVVQVLDSKNLSRGLPITIQLAEMGLPFILVLNMWDEANSRGINIDVKRLASAMGTFIIPTIAVERKGLKELRDALSEKKYPSILINYGTVIEEGIKEIENILPESNISRRAIALMLLAGDESLKSWLKRLINYPDITRIESVRREVQEKFFEPVGYLINQTSPSQIYPGVP
ncbi:MAG: hypothetical protein A2035_08010 [Nitrospirae bacterium GWA2_42_11]|nr:MAG: hypothetical protein A2035_08010 [Nitrospirae bacterium GWA2_42_11]